MTTEVDPPTSAVFNVPIACILLVAEIILLARIVFDDFVCVAVRTFARTTAAGVAQQQQNQPKEYVPPGGW